MGLVSNLTMRKKCSTAARSRASRRLTTACSTANASPCNKSSIRTQSRTLAVVIYRPSWQRESAVKSAETHNTAGISEKQATGWPRPSSTRHTCLTSRREPTSQTGKIVSNRWSYTCSE